jgi:hypothetical protein
MISIQPSIPTEEEVKMYVVMKQCKDRQAYKEQLIDEYIKATPNATINDIHDKADQLSKLVYP